MVVLRQVAIKVYPRVCGGTCLLAPVALGFLGLSPRVRGNLGRVQSLDDDFRSIPACAGEPIDAGCRRTRIRVYPRVCGGTLYQEWQINSVEGLSPRVRGNRKRRCPAVRCPGSIPACAGEPWHSAPTSTRYQVYPRVCGGTAQVFAVRRVRRGLSPRVRGNPSLW